MDQVTFRTTDNTRWGAGFGSDLSATQIDINFWVLLSAIEAINSRQEGQAGIDHFVITGDQLFVHLTNHFVLGPFTLPTAEWNFKGEWQPLSSYHAFDVVTNQRAVYLVLVDHRSNNIFAPGANDGAGHNFYGLLLAAAPAELPQTGAQGAVLTWHSSPLDVAWITPTRNIAFYMETPPDPLEVVLEYVFTENTTFPAGLTRSKAFAHFWPTITQSYNIYQAGAPVGSIDFHPSPTDAQFTFAADITFTPGEVMTIVAPSVIDQHMMGICATLVGLLP